MHVDHIRSGSTDRLDSAWFGVGNQLKEKAWDAALAMATSSQPQQPSMISLEAAAMNQIRENALSLGGKIPSFEAAEVAAKMMAAKAIRAGSKD